MLSRRAQIPEGRGPVQLGQGGLEDQTEVVVIIQTGEGGGSDPQRLCWGYNLGGTCQACVLCLSPGLGM